MKVINLCAGPGAGKSTTAAGLFNIMKLKGFNCELVTEFAKDLTWEGRMNTLSNQLYILAKQEARLARLEGKVDYVVTDSPLLLGLVYVNERFRKAWFHNAVRGAFDLYDNVLFLLERTKPYQPVGRNQTAQEAVLLDHFIADMLKAEGHPFTRIVADESASRTIYQHVFGEPAE
ncbi:MAG: hypothetical protein EOQ89_03480 [Mesorhizobium sp.]|nr:MAG: hypothetical protein EOQ89_03480 [Mesorhizobium sp.]